MSIAEFEARNCLSPAQLDALIASALDRPRAAALESHLASCPRCQQLWEERSSTVQVVAQTQLAAKSPRPAQLEATLTVASPPAAGQSASPQAASASQQFGDYELLGEIAKGGMGVVFKARQVKLNRLVALKMIKSGELADEDQVQRFYREAESAARLDHRGIVPVYEVGSVGGRHFFSMALVAGQSLSDRVKRDGPLPPQHAATLLRAVAQAVHYAHGRDIVHRDLKPQNVLLDETDQPRVTDFGLAKQTHVASDLTLSGQIMGTPSYMPPEQATGSTAEIGVASDVYSLGATLYFALTARPPFQAATAIDTIRQVLDGDPVPPRRLDPAIPRDLETICLKCLRKQPAQRYASAAELADDLTRWLENRAIVARPVGLVERGWLFCKRRPALVGLTAAFLVISLVAGGIAVERHYATRAAGLVDAYLNAETKETPALAAELRRYWLWAQPLLVRRHAEAAEDSKVKLHASLALAKDDARHVDGVVERLWTARPEDIAVYCDVFAAQDVDFGERFWQVIGRSKQRREQLRAASVLARIAPDDERWQTWSEELARELVTVSPLELKAWTDNLRPVRLALIRPLQAIFQSRVPEEANQRSLAAASLADYLADQPQRLLQLALLAENEAEFAPLIEKLAVHREVIVPALHSALAPEIPATEKDSDHVYRQAASAAVGLLELGEDRAVWPLLEHSADPTRRSYLIRRLHQLGASPEMIADRLGVERGVSIRRALILCLGNYSPLQLTAQRRQELIATLAAEYRTDPDPGIHSAIAWTLRHWDQADSLREMDAGLQGPPAADRGWFVNSAGQTMLVVRGPTPAMELIFTENEAPPKAPQAISIQHSFAIASHEVTWEQYLAFNPVYMVYARFPPAPNVAVIAGRFENAAAYCNWLSQREGIPKEQWCYPTNEKGELGDLNATPADFLARRGYRLPTEAEWEFVSRAGATTLYGFGESPALLEDYGWFLENSRQLPGPVGGLKPNDLGAFDCFGNMAEWCHRGHPNDGVPPAAAGQTRRAYSVVRGGSYLLERRNCTSQRRFAFEKSLLADQVHQRSLGFRVARSLPPIASKPEP